MLTVNQIQDLKDAEKVLFATSFEGQPRAIWVIPSKIASDEIIISNIQMEKSIQNIKANPKCYLNALLPEKEDLQYKIEGFATVEEEGSEFEQIKNFEESENLPPELKVNSIIRIKIVSVETSNG